MHVLASLLVFKICGEFLPEVGTVGAIVVAACASVIQIQIWRLGAQKGEPK
jgi:hypothetical protein